MSIPLLVEFFQELPERDEGEEPSRKGTARFRKALEGFRHKTAVRYSEGTLQRLLESTDPLTRRATVLALGLLGTMESNRPLAGMLHDADAVVRQLAADSLWAIWFRGDSEQNNRQLQRLIRLHNPGRALAGLEELIHKAPDFAEAYNQRAIVFFRIGEYEKSIEDCQSVLRLNPFHFGAQSGMGQCYMKIHKPRQALKAFRQALRMHPGLDGVEHTIRALEDVLGEEGRMGKNEE